MLQAGCRSIVFSSTCAVYGEPNDTPICETAPKDPVNPYGSSKLMIERILGDYARAYGLEFIALRYFNACGAEIGEMRDPETHLIPRAMMAIQGHITDFAVFGNDYPTPDGTAIRDYVHVSDLADAHVASLRRLLENGGGGLFNLGTGRGLSVKQVGRRDCGGNRRTTHHKFGSPASRRPGHPGRGCIASGVGARLQAAAFGPENHHCDGLELAPESAFEERACWLRLRFAPGCVTAETKISGGPLT
jgi:UDP-glucose 4-epimerase